MAGEAKGKNKAFTEEEAYMVRCSKPKLSLFLKTYQLYIKR